MTPPPIMRAGRKTKIINVARLLEMHATGCGDTEIAKVLGCSVSKVGRVRRGLGLSTNFESDHWSRRCQQTWQDNKDKILAAHRISMDQLWGEGRPGNREAQTIKPMTRSTMTREKLPDRRRCLRIKAVVGGQTVYLEFGEFPDGSLGEIWLTASKVGTFLKGIVETLARTVSISLQCGETIEDICESLIGQSYPPQGEVRSEGGSILWADSVADWVGKEILHRYGAKPTMPTPPEKRARIKDTEGENL